MNVKILLLSLLFSFNVFAQNSFWKQANFSIDETIVPKDRMPNTYKTYEVDLTSLKQSLLNATDFKVSQDSNTFLNIPDEKGQLINFKIFKSSTLDQEVKNNSDIQTYRGYSNNGDIASIVVSKLGLFIGVLKADDKDFIIEPAGKNLNNVIVFSKDQLPPISFECLTDDKGNDLTDITTNSTRIDDGLLRTYRFAVGTTGEYSQYHVNRAINAGIITSNASDSEKKNVVLAAVAVTIDRVNSVYERDFGVTLELVPNETNAIFLDPNNDPYDNSDIMSMLNGNTNVLNTQIGSNNYDGGHLFSTYAGGGISGLGIICGSSKGRSVTGSTSPVGDGYDIDYVAHEIGHAFGCHHTFANDCNGNRTLSTAVEPGSGSSIMAYAGVCSPNVQLHSDDYFHVMSISEAENFIQNYATCSTNTNIGNHAPSINTVNYGTVSIPKSTPFMLKANATDQDQGDALTYCWEQIDTPSSSSVTNWIPNSNYDNGPAFRTFDPTTNNVRYLPTMVNIVNNTYGNSWERLPAVDRTLTFVVTVRDNHPGGGQTPYDYLQFNVDSSTGPFRITNMSNGQTLQAGQTQTITWDVAGTDGSPINCNSVDILFSADNGTTFPVVVASNLPNNGSAQFTVPNYQNTTLGRFMVKAHNNYFFDVAHGRFTIQGVSGVAENNLPDLNIFPNPVKNNLNISFKVIDLQNNIKIQITDISGREVISKLFNENSSNFDKSIDISHLTKGIYFVRINNGENRAVKKIIVE
jgi:hypothetical protein